RHSHPTRELVDRDLDHSRATIARSPCKGRMMYGSHSTTGTLSPSLYRAGAGEQLVLLHGATGSWRHWRPVLADLVPHFEVIAPTLPGHAGCRELLLDAPPSLP